MTDAQRYCRMCPAQLPAGSRSDRQFCSNGCRQRRYDRSRRRRRTDPARSLALGRLYTLVDMLARRLPEPVLPAHLALAYRQEFRVPFQVEWLPRLCARWGCGRPLPPYARPERAFCRNACRQRAYRQAQRRQANSVST
ncbi:hypothetical protein Sya03_57160 [Spirilliplanes yamanashiensis]|uniref:Uncharacterized protein n=1 Tax=Spirilliplanes yamanashiensis TaxID=42233 RepID=A0A8J3YE29_9ACTN|nr:hypothetical protein Sya03_57160 [Spirilliplanes yamanashiensis]